MKASEWVRITATLRRRWPNANLPEDTVRQWGSDLSDLPADEVAAAADALYMDGREFPPNGGQIRAKVADIERGDPDHGEAWRLAMSAVRRFSSYRKPDAMAWLTEQSSATAKAVERFGFTELCRFDLSDESTVRAQFRDIYRAVCRERQREGSYAGLGSSERPGLGKPDYARLIEG